ncbi:TetR/AcrR family transcriptional regulator [Rhizobium sp. AN70]|uniref:TetR/AcrR family transcriptional regulator n=1 Tax=Rhizobium sp. AN70 TaxID=3035123 RepID=UPI00247ADAE9|nr:TetR/AcrR family transcriptional regulator [Rhizobium sp. AN70]
MTEKSTRGRPRQYDARAALDAALLEFRRHGYSATSLDHLSEATKMARPSLYAAFGNKRAIYLRAVAQHIEDSAERRNHALFSEPSLAKALNDYFMRIIAIYSEGDDYPLGCPVLSVITGEATADPVMGAELSAAIGRTDARFRARIVAARDDAQLPPEVDIDATADMLAALQHSLAQRARAGTARPELERIARNSIALILKATGATQTL